jgi:hypothetical protein
VANTSKIGGRIEEKEEPLEWKGWAGQRLVLFD